MGEERYPDELLELCKGYVKHSLESAEKASEMEQNYTVEQIDHAVSDVVEQTLQNIDDGTREVNLYVTVLSLGKAVRSEEMVQFAQERLQSMGEG